MFRYGRFQRCWSGRWALLLSLKMIDCGSGSVVLLAAATFMGVLIGLPLPTVRAETAWQPIQIRVGDGKDGSITFPAKKKKCHVPDSSYTMPFGLAQMDNGQVVMIGTWETETTAYPIISFSSDQGNTWSAFQKIPGNGRPTMLTYLGGGRMFYHNGDVYCSDDYGKTWLKQPLDEARLIDEKAYLINEEAYLINEGNAAVDRDASGKAVRVMEIGSNNGSNGPWPASDDATRFRYSLDGGGKWQGDVEPPTWKFSDTYNGQSYQWGTTEGSLVRAANGWLVAALRTDPPSRFTVAKIGDDNLCGTGISISKDNGQTWSPLNRIFDAGRHHADLRLLPNGDLLLTMIVRNDMQFGGGQASHRKGVDALISHDNGLTWNLDRRITLDAFDYFDPKAPYDGKCGHVATTVLTDGSVLTAYGKYVDGSAVLIKWNPAAIGRK